MKGQNFNHPCRTQVYYAAAFFDDARTTPLVEARKRLKRLGFSAQSMVLYARDIVEKDFLSLSAGSTVLEGARAMKNVRHGFAIIGTTADPQGLVTEWDILSKVVAEGLDPQRVTLGEIMSTDLLSVDSGAGLEVVAQLMSDRGVRRLLVKDKGKVVGYITSRTMLKRMNDYVGTVSSQISKLQTPWF